MTQTLNLCDLCKRKCEPENLRNGLSLELAGKPKVVNVKEMCGTCAEKVSNLLEELKK